jgi:hypothetical protein
MTLVISLYVFGSVETYADNRNFNLEKVYKLLQQKQFKEVIKELEMLSLQNEINAQLLYSKILFSGDITPQNFESSYFWASAALLGGLKDGEKITRKLDNYLSIKQIENVKDKLNVFLEKRVFNKDKRAIIQIAKFYESFIDPPDMINAYTWYNIAVAKGIKTAKNKRDETLSSLNEKDLLEAQTLSIKLFKQINN